MSESLFGRKPAVSVVVVVYNMAREAPRTLYTLSSAYQRDIAPEDYEVIVVDNGSTPAFDASIFDTLEGNFRVIRLSPAHPSPAEAINVGLAAAKGDVIGVMIDGARMVTPGLLHFARSGMAMYPRAVVATLGWYLGLDQQRWAIEGGYNKDREDALLDSVEWRENGYRLFDIGAADETTAAGWYGAICESNALFLSRDSWNLMGGADERFDFPGGGFLNLDLIARAYELPGCRLVVLLGEGTFHQLHGGVSTSASPQTINDAVAVWRAQYEAIRGYPWAPPTGINRVFVGALPAAALRHFTSAVVHPVGWPPLGEAFRDDHWTTDVKPEPADPTAAALLYLARNEYSHRRFEAAAAVARMARQYAPDERAILDLLATASLSVRGPADPSMFGQKKHAGFHLACANAYKIMGRREEEEAALLAALQSGDDVVEAYVALAELRMPGDPYMTWLGNLHACLAPRTYLEIGIESGRSLALARPPTRAFGVDPTPYVRFPFQTETHIYTETSDEFFARQRLETTLGGEPVDFAFIDGAHLFQQTLRDFINVEAHCGPRSVVALHDTIPFDEVTQRPVREKQFYTGDAWKLMLCLRRYRQDLEMITVPASWSGLTLILNPNPSSGVLAEHFDDIVACFGNLDYEASRADLDRALDVSPNDWSLVEPRLLARAGVQG